MIAEDPALTRWGCGSPDRRSHHKISPRALMLIGAEKDDLCKIDGYKAVFDKAGEPKKWVQYPITHYQIYTPEWVAPSAKVAAEFFTEHLKR